MPNNQHLEDFLDSGSSSDSNTLYVLPEKNCRIAEQLVQEFFEHYSGWDIEHEIEPAQGQPEVSKIVATSGDDVAQLIINLDIYGDVVRLVKKAFLKMKSRGRNLADFEQEQGRFHIEEGEFTELKTEILKKFLQTYASSTSKIQSIGGGGIVSVVTINIEDSIMGKPTSYSMTIILNKARSKNREEYRDIYYAYAEAVIR